MSQNVRFEEKETIKTTVNGGNQGGGQGGGGDRGGRGGPSQAQAPKGSGEKQDFAHKVGDALTKGGSPDGYLAVCAQRTTMTQWMRS